MWWVDTSTFAAENQRFRPINQSERGWYFQGGYRPSGAPTHLCHHARHQKLYVALRKRYWAVYTETAKFQSLSLSFTGQNIGFRQRLARCCCQLITLKVLLCLNKHSKRWPCVLKVLSQCLNDQLQVEIPLGNIPRLHLAAIRTKQHYLRQAPYIYSAVQKWAYTCLKDKKNGILRSLFSREMYCFARRRAWLSLPPLWG